jgi:hypothetical protein
MSNIHQLIDQEANAKFTNFTLSEFEVCSVSDTSPRDFPKFRLVKIFRHFTTFCEKYFFFKFVNFFNNQGDQSVPNFIKPLGFVNLLELGAYSSS